MNNSSSKLNKITPVKILIITDLYPIKESEKYTPHTLQSFVKSWQKQGHEVKVIKPNFLLNSFLRGKPFYKNGTYGDVKNINFLFPFLKVPPLNYKPDIILAHMPSGLIYANRLGLPFCAAVHNSDLEVLTNPIYSIYFKSELEKAYQNANKIFARSEVLKQKFLKLYPQYENKIFTAPSGIDENIIVKREWKEKERIKVLTCGQFIKRKNIDKVILACKNFKNIDLTVIGSGKMEHQLKKLSSNAKFTGQIPHEKVIKIMRESNIFILPSVNETFGMVYLEAMASGCITVCAQNDGIDGIIKDSVNGFLAAPDTPGIENCLKKIFAFTPKSEILENAYNTICDYTSDKTAETYLNSALIPSL